MEFEILVFGIIKQKTGVPKIKIEIEGNPSVKNLVEEFHKLFPEFEKLQAIIAVNNNYVNEDVLLNPKDEIAIINPKIICLLGSTSYYSILGGKEISKNHGKLISKDNHTYFITFHPAATIYNQKLVNVFKNDIIKLVKELQKLKMRSAD